jgi:hypothetical protein
MTASAPKVAGNVGAGRVVVRPHPAGGWTHARPVAGSARVYAGWWPSLRAARAALRR